VLVGRIAAPAVRATRRLLNQAEEWVRRLGWAIRVPGTATIGFLVRSHSVSFDHRRRPEALRTAMATAFFCPTSTTRRLPLVTPV
jgi:hypothetical protein